MASNKFKTVPDELTEFAEVCATHFETSGYMVRIERDELGFPYTPTLLATRKPTKLILEVATKIDGEKIDAWMRYGKSCGTDTRVALAIPHTINLSNEDQQKLRQRGLGLYACSQDGVVELIVPSDLALNVALPTLASMPAQIRGLLGSAYDQFNRGQWREGFEEACQVVEVEARKHLLKWTKTGRIKIIRKGVPISLPARKINSMTMGALASAYGLIQAQNHADSVIEKLLTTLNQDRIGVVHHKRKVLTEKRLRTNVGQHMWKIVAGLKVII
jgi:hypothetical protein